MSALTVAIAAQEPAPVPADELQTFARELINAPAPKRNDLLANHPDLMSARLRRELVRQGNLLLLDSKYRPAFEIYQLAQQLAERIDDKEGVATTALNIGSVYYFQGNYDLALENYRRAHELFVSLANPSEAARSLFGIGITFQAQKKLNDALREFEQAAKEYEALGDDDELANTLSAIGSIQSEQGNYEAAAKTLVRVGGLNENADSLLRIAEAFYRQTDYAEALRYYERSLDYANKQRNAAQQIGALTGAANCYYYQRNYDQALEYYDRSLRLSESLDDKAGVATQLQNIGNIYRALGDYALALQSYFKSLAAAEAANTKGTVPNTLGSIGLVRSLQGDNTEALEYFQKSLHEFEQSGDLVGMARMLSYIGNAEYVRGEYAPALAAYERSLELYGSRSDRVHQAHLLLGIGAVYVKQQKYTEAAQNYQRALTIYEGAGRKADAADALLRLAALQRLQKNYAAGLEFANNALRLAREADSLTFTAAALTETGRLQRGLKRPAEALDSFAHAIKTQATLNAEPVDVAETVTNHTLPYLGAMEVFVEQDNAVEAFKRADEAKSQTLREIMNRGNFRVTKDMTAAERRDENKLLGDMASLQLQLTRAQESANKDDAQPTALQVRLNATRASYAALRKQLYAKHPRLPVNRGELTPVNLAELRPLLRREAAILEYAVTEDSIFLFVVTNEAAVSAYQLSIKPAELAQYASVVAASQELYDGLVKPAEQQLAGKTQLIIVPDGALWDIPFADLRSDAGKSLGEQKTISYAISVAALREMHKRNTLWAGNRSNSAGVLIVGSPNLADEVKQRLTTTYRDFTLPAVTTPQLDQFRSVYGKSRSDLITGAAATKDRIAKEVTTHQFLHFATPALLDNATPLYSVVLLSAAANHADDGLLRLREVTSLNSKARVVAFPTVIFTNSVAQTPAAFIATSWAWFVAGTPTVILQRSDIQMILGDSLANR